MLTGADITVIAVVCTDMFSVDKLPNVVGILSMFEGIATSIPLAGKPCCRVELY